MKQTMTLEEIKAVQGDWLTIEQAAAFFDRDAQIIRVQAKTDRESLDYLGAVVIGSRVSFWKPAFVSHFERLVEHENKTGGNRSELAATGS